MRYYAQIDTTENITLDHEMAKWFAEYNISWRYVGSQFDGTGYKEYNYLLGNIQPSDLCAFSIMFPTVVTHLQRYED